MKSLILTLALFSYANGAHAQMTQAQNQQIRAAQALCKSRVSVIVSPTDPQNDPRCVRAAPTVDCCDWSPSRPDAYRDSDGNIYYPIHDNGHYDPYAKPVPNECHYIQHCVNNGYMAPPSCGPQLICSYGPVRN